MHLKTLGTLDCKQFIRILRGTAEEIDPILLDRLFPAAVVSKPSGCEVGNINNNGTDKID